jgi:hypothetical protein
VAYNRTYYRQTAFRRVAGSVDAQWDGADEQRVLAHSIPDEQLANELNRSVRSIQIKRYRLKHEVTA